MTTQHKAILASAVIALFGVSTVHAEDKPRTPEPAKAGVEAPKATSGAQSAASNTKQGQAKAKRGLTVAERNLLQNRLRTAGFYKGKINGRLDEDTQKALMAYQRKHGLVPTGTPNEPTLTSLGIMSSMASAKPPRAKGTNGDGKARRNRDGLPDQNTDLSTLSMAETRAIQQTLHRYGFFVGEIDGIAGPSTVRALEEYYQSKGIVASRDKTRKEPSSMAVKQSEIERVRGTEAPGPRDKAETPSAREIEPGLDNIPRSTGEPTPRK